MLSWIGTVAQGTVQKRGYCPKAVACQQNSISARVTRSRTYAVRHCHRSRVARAYAVRRCCHPVTTPSPPRRISAAAGTLSFSSCCPLSTLSSPAVSPFPIVAPCHFLACVALNDCPPLTWLSRSLARQTRFYLSVASCVICGPLCCLAHPRKAQTPSAEEVTQLYVGLRLTSVCVPMDPLRRHVFLPRYDG